MCPAPATTDLDELLKAEGTRTFEVRGRTSRAEGWFDLACARARLFALDAIAREGLVMLPGDSWGQGAISALLEGLKRQPDSAAAELLGVLSFDVHPDRLRRGMIEFFRRSADNAKLGRFALRACSALFRDEGDVAAADRCSNLALQRGVDSTWQSISLARSAFQHGDISQGLGRFAAAAASIRDEDDRVALDWHLDWFLEPAELAEWDSLATSRAEWVRNLLAERDLRDGQPDGSRLAEHFSRLEAVDTLFRLRRPLLRQRRFELTASPENILSYEWVAKWVDKDPAGVPARPFRFYQRKHPEY
ncbi:MAG TPA: hypothetical protein PLL69_06885, partial [Gemmatimonadales bacterium]|nr:hypothetical protein [Gemmatimonadales bacterium]